MKTIHSLFLWAFFGLFSALVNFAQAQVPQMQADFGSPWLVEVDGESRTRTLRISGSKQIEPGIFELDAVYGWTDGSQTTVKAELLIGTDQKRTLRITTQPGSKITAVQGQDGIFLGTFTPTNGKAKELKIKQLSEDAIAVIRDQPAENPVITSPGADVPASCARFIGGWAGDWSFGKRWLWITGVNASCVAKYSYSPQARTSKFKTIEIKDGILSFPCGTSGGTCFFERHGDDLWGRYAGSDGTNGAVFREITPSKK